MRRSLTGYTKWSYTDCMEQRDDLKVQLWGYRCTRCGHEWLPHRPKPEEAERTPRVCPRCKSPYWSVPRRNKRSEDVGGPPANEAS